MKRDYLKYLIQNTAAGVVLGLNAIVFCIAYAAFFSSIDVSLVIFISRFYLIGSAVVMIITSLTSPIPYAISAPQNHAVPILLIIVSQIVNFINLHSNNLEIYPTLFAVFAITTITTGLSYFLIGYWRQGNLIRYIPYPVICGFLAGLGWTLFIKAMLVLVDDQGIEDFFIIFLSIFFAIIALGLRKYQKPLLLLILFFLSIMVFYLFLYFSGISIAQVTEKNWLFSFPVHVSAGANINLLEFQYINWTAIYRVIPWIFIILLINNISILLNILSVELLTREDIDCDKDLVSTGIANMVAGLAGGVAGYLVIGQTALARLLGAKGSWAGVVAGLMCLAVVFFGTQLLSFVPRFVLFGMIISIAISVLHQWLYKTFYTLNIQEYCILVTIFMVIVAFDFLAGVIAGVLLSMIVFIINYSKIHVIRYILDGRTIRSKMVRNRESREILQEHAEELIYMKLDGYIFFGTAYTLMKTIKDRIEKSQPPVRFLILDFSSVDGIDSSVHKYFLRLKQLTLSHGFFLIFTSLSPLIKAELLKEDMLGKEVLVFDKKDAALQYCENRIINSRLSDISHTQSFEKQVEKIINSPENAKKLAKYFEKLLLKENECLASQNGISDNIYFIEKGSISVILNTGTEDLLLRKLGSGNFLGEMGFYSQRPRSANLIADEDCVLWVLSQDSMKNMEQSDPDLVIFFERMIVNIISDRLLFANHQLATLSL